MNPVDIARPWNSSGNCRAPTNLSPTQAKLQDEIMERSMAMLRMIASQSATIQANDLLLEQLRSVGLEGDIVTHLDDDACTVCVAIRPKRYADLCAALDHYSHPWRLIDAHHGLRVNICTLEVTVCGRAVFLTATVNAGDADEARLAA